MKISDEKLNKIVAAVKYVNHGSPCSHISPCPNCAKLKRDLAHQKKLVKILADKLNEWDETPDKEQNPFDFIAWAESKIKARAKKEGT